MTQLPSRASAHGNFPSATQTPMPGDPRATKGLEMMMLADAAAALPAAGVRVVPAIRLPPRVPTRLTGAPSDQVVVVAAEAAAQDLAQAPTARPTR